MKTTTAAVGSLVLLAVTAFCVFGFLASFEPGDNAMAFRIGYGAIGISCLVGVGFLIRNAIRN